MSGREAFESVMRALGFDHPDRDHLGAMMKIAWAVWSARDAELAAKDARIAELEAALYCENSPYEAKTHRCVHCDEEVLRDE